MLHQKQLYWTQMLEINSLQSKEQSSCLCNDFIMVAFNDRANSVNDEPKANILNFVSTLNVVAVWNWLWLIYT